MIQASASIKMLNTTQMFKPLHHSQFRLFYLIRVINLLTEVAPAALEVQQPAHSVAVCTRQFPKNRVNYNSRYFQDVNICF